MVCTRTISVQLDPSAAEKYDAALSGDDNDVLLEVERAIMATLYPERVITGGLGGTQIDLDADLIAVEPAEDA